MSSFKIIIPEDKINETPEIKDYVGREVVFGIRPEDLIDSSITRDLEVSDENSIEALVEVVEPMGSEIYLYLTIKDHSMVARVEAESKAKVGDKVKLGVVTKKMHIFDAETEDAIF